MSSSIDTNTSSSTASGGVIPAEQAKVYQSWLLPDVGTDKAISSAEKIKRDKEKESASKKRQENNETIEIIDDVSVQPHTAEQLQQITETAEKEGYDSGYQKGIAKGEAEGYQAGVDAAREKIASDAEHLHNITEALLIPLDIEQKKLESFLITTVTQLAKIVIQRELITDSSMIKSVVESTLQLVPNPTEKLTLYLNPTDIALLESYAPPQYEQLLYQADASLLPGGCRLESHDTTIDASIERRIEQVFDDFLHQRYTSGEDINETPSSEEADDSSNHGESL